MPGQLAAELVEALLVVEDVLLLDSDLVEELPESALAEPADTVDEPPLRLSVR